MAKKGRIPKNKDGTCPEGSHRDNITTKKGVEQKICRKNKTAPAP